VKNEWSDIDKAQWILENGEPKHAWIYERNGELLYRRPMATDSELPPWVSRERELVKSYNYTGKYKHD
jgi:hypothetical protein